MTSLFERIGGQDAINAAVDIFYGKVLADNRVNQFFDDVDMPGQIGKQRIFLAYAFGGPVKHTGKDLRSAHAHLDLSEEHFVSIAEYLGRVAGPERAD